MVANIKIKSTAGGQLLFDSQIYVFIISIQGDEWWWSLVNKEWLVTVE